MAQAQTNKIQLLIQSVLSGGTIGLAGIKSTLSENIQSDFSTDACDSFYTASGTISGLTDDYDLAGALTNPLGQAVTFAEVMAVFVRNNGDNAMTVGGTNNIPMFASTTDLVNLAADAYFLYCDQAGITVTAGTGDLITITGTNDDTYDIIVIGSST